jgi:prevent-host-death family protein
MPTTVGLFEAKQKLSELVERASRGEEIIITCRGKGKARLVRTENRGRTIDQVVQSMSRVKMRLPKGMTLKDLITMGRKY